MAYFDASRKINSAAPVQGRPFALLAKDAFGYAIVSALALATDWGGLIVLARSGLPKFFVMAVPFLLGLLVAYVLSIYFVFNQRRILRSGAEIGVFLITGAIGLGLNVVLLEFFANFFHCPLEIAKAPTIFFVFSFNFLSRRYFLTHPSARKLFERFNALATDRS